MPLDKLMTRLEAAIHSFTHVDVPPYIDDDPVLHVIKLGDAEQVMLALRTSAAPVCFVPNLEMTPKEPLKILAPVDFLTGTESTLEFVYKLATALPAEVILCTVVHPPKAPGLRDALFDDAYRALSVHARNAGFDADAIGLRVLEADVISDTILGEADTEHCSLIVLASHGKDAIARFFVGSTTEALLRQTDRPVLVLPRNPGL